MDKRSYLAETCHCLVNFLRVDFPESSVLLSYQQPLKLHSPVPFSDHSGQLVYEIINSVDHELDVVPLGHAVMAMPPQDDIHIGAEDTLCNLHGDVPGYFLVFEPVNQPYGTSDGDGTLEDTVIFCLSQEVHAEPIKTLL